MLNKDRHHWVEELAFLQWGRGQVSKTLGRLQCELLLDLVEKIDSI